MKAKTALFVPQEPESYRAWKKYAEPINQEIIKRRSKWYKGKK